MPPHLTCRELVTKGATGGSLILSTEYGIDCGRGRAGQPGDVQAGGQSAPYLEAMVGVAVRRLPFDAAHPRGITLKMERRSKRMHALAGHDNPFDRPTGLT